MSRDFFNRKAAGWDEFAAEKDVTKLRSLADRLEIQPGAAVLDVGTGTGIFVPYILARIGASGSLVCLDYASEMLKLAEQKEYNRGRVGNIRYVCADIMAHGLAEAAFDAVVCYSVFPHFEDKPAALTRLYRLLKPGGRLLVCHTAGSAAINRIHAGLPEVHDHRLPDAAGMTALLGEAGFTDVCVTDGAAEYLASGVRP
jgi:ubiquinone/menaquinone biosynthesis C-methylase UbiE